MKKEGGNMDNIRGPSSAKDPSLDAQATPGKYEYLSNAIKGKFMPNMADCAKSVLGGLAKEGVSKASGATTGLLGKIAKVGDTTSIGGIVILTSLYFGFKATLALPVFALEIGSDLVSMVKHLMKSSRLPQSGAKRAEYILEIAGRMLKKSVYFTVCFYLPIVAPLLIACVIGVNISGKSKSAISSLYENATDSYASIKGFVNGERSPSEVSKAMEESRARSMEAMLDAIGASPSEKKEGLSLVNADNLNNNEVSPEAKKIMDSEEEILKPVAYKNDPTVYKTDMFYDAL